jgi:hypothetical protein
LLPCTIYFIPTGAINFSLLRNVQTGSGAQPASYSVGIGVKRPGRDVDHSPPNAEVRMRGAMLLLPLYAFMAWTGIPFLLVLLPSTLTLRNSFLEHSVIVSSSDFQEKLGYVP